MALIPCPGCGRIISDSVATCVQCGRPTSAKPATQPDASPQAAAHPGGALATTPAPPPLAGGPTSGQPPRVVEPVQEHTFFPITTSKFIVMSIFTFGLYDIYWAYKNWKRINTRATSNDSVSPFWRALFAPIWGFSLFTRVRDTAERRVNVWWDPGLLGGLYLVLSVIWRLRDPWWFISLLAFVPIIPVVRTIEALHATEPASEGQNAGYSAVNIVTIIVGGIMLLLAIVGTLYPPPEGGDIASDVQASALRGFAVIGAPCLLYSAVAGD